MDKQTQIDTLLKLNSAVRANLGTFSSKDVKTKETADIIWTLILEQIKELDLDQYNRLKP